MAVAMEKILAWKILPRLDDGGYDFHVYPRD